MFTSASYAQTSKDTKVVLIQTFKMKGPLGNDAEAFRDMLKRQGDVVNKDPRVVKTYVLRHFWGADSRDLVIVSEFKNLDDLFSFSDDSNALFEKALSKKQVDADNELWNKYVGQHADEIYQVYPGSM
jgi:hypothetical protein